MLWWNVFITDKTRQQTYQAPLRHLVYVLKTFKKEFRVTPTARHHNTTRYRWGSRMVQQLYTSMKPYGKVRLCIDPARLHQVLILPVNRGLTLNDIFPKLNSVIYFSFIDVSSGYHNLYARQKIIIHQNICMHIWQVQTQEIDVWSSPCRRWVSKKKRQNI